MQALAVGLARLRQTPVDSSVRNKTSPRLVLALALAVVSSAVVVLRPVGLVQEHQVASVPPLVDLVRSSNNNSSLLKTRVPLSLRSALIPRRTDHQTILRVITKALRFSSRTRTSRSRSCGKQTTMLDVGSATAMGRQALLVKAQDLVALALQRQVRPLVDLEQRIQAEACSVLRPRPKTNRHSAKTSKRPTLVGLAVEADYLVITRKRNRPGQACLVAHQHPPVKQAADSLEPLPILLEVSVAEALAATITQQAQPQAAYLAAATQTSKRRTSRLEALDPAPRVALVPERLVALVSSRNSSSSPALEVQVCSGTQPRRTITPLAEPNNHNRILAAVSSVDSGRTKTRQPNRIRTLQAVVCLVALVKTRIRTLRSLLFSAAAPEPLEEVFSVAGTRINSRHNLQVVACLAVRKTINNLEASLAPSLRQVEAASLAAVLTPLETIAGACSEPSHKLKTRPPVCSEGINSSSKSPVSSAVRRTTIRALPSVT